MSSSFRSHVLTIGVAAGGGALCCLLAARANAAAEWYLQPNASLQGSYSTNVELSPVPGQQPNAAGYYAELGTIIGAQTPTSLTIIRPDIRYEYYPQDSELDRVEGFLDLRSAFTYERDRFSFIGRWDRRDDLYAEIPDAQYNPINPEVPVPPSTGHVSTGVVRNYFYLLPNYEHSLTPLSSVGVTGTVQRLTNNPDNNSDYVDFNYYQVNPYYNYKYSPRADFSIGAFAGRYEGLNI